MGDNLSQPFAQRFCWSAIFFIQCVRSNKIAGWMVEQNALPFPEKGKREVVSKQPPAKKKRYSPELYLDTTKCRVNEKSQAPFAKTARGFRVPAVAAEGCRAGLMTSRSATLPDFSSRRSTIRRDWRNKCGCRRSRRRR